MLGRTRDHTRLLARTGKLTRVPSHDSRVRVTRASVEEYAKTGPRRTYKKRPGTQREKILAALRQCGENGATRQELKTMLTDEITPVQTGRALDTMVMRGIVVRHGPAMHSRYTAQVEA